MTSPFPSWTSRVRVPSPAPSIQQLTGIPTSRASFEPCSATRHSSRLTAARPNGLISRHFLGFECQRGRLAFIASLKKDPPSLQWAECWVQTMGRVIQRAVRFADRNDREDFPVLPLGQDPGHHEMLSRLRDHSLVDHMSPLERMEAEEVAQVRDLAADRVRVPLLLAGFLFDNRPPRCNCPTPSTRVQTSNSRRSGVRQRLLAQQYPPA